MEVTQSVLFSITRVKLGLYEQRIITKVVEYAQGSLKGENPTLYKKQIIHKDPNCFVEFPARYILDVGNDHYNLVYDALRNLMSRKLEYYDAEKKEWFGSPLIYNATLKKGSGLVSFYVARQLVDIILNFSSGYKSYNIETALTLPSPAAVRLYIIMSKQTTPLCMKIDNLKKMFGVADKYDQTADFIKKVIEPARKALEEAKVDGFTYSRVKESRKVVALTFFPLKVTKEASQFSLQTKEDKVASVAVRMLLKESAFFTDSEIAANTKTRRAFCKIPGAVDLLQNIIHKSHRADNQKGYIVAAMKKETEAFKKDPNKHKS